MYLVTLDTETELLERGNTAPRLACMSVAREGKSPALFGRKSALDIFHSYVEDPEAILIGHNIPFDLGVLASEDETLELPIFEAYRRGRIRDTEIREKLVIIRSGAELHGGIKLEDLAKKYLGVYLNKGEDSWRYWYGELMFKPLDQWPAEARDYAIDDAGTTLTVFVEQQKLKDNPASPAFVVSPDEVLQTRAAWVLHLMRMWGFRTDKAMVARLRANLEEEVAKAEIELIEKGFFKVKSTRKATRDLRGQNLINFLRDNPDTELSKDMAAIKARVKAAYHRQGLEPPMTEGRVNKDLGIKIPEVSTGKEALEGADDPDLQQLAEAEPNRKLLSTFVPLVEAGVDHPITPRWNVLVSTGRTSCGSSEDDESGNWQNPKKKGGIRECVIARSKFPDMARGGIEVPAVFISVDYSQVELCTLGQVLKSRYGHSRLADTINEGRDLHLDLAVSFDFLLAPMTYEEAKIALKTKGHPDQKRVKEKRQICKAMNFGFPGGLGWETFITYARVAWGVKGMNEMTSKAAKAAWFKKWPEMELYFRDIAEETELGLPAVQLFSGRVRGNPSFCARANGFFQGLAADGAKEALWNVAYNCYVNKKSPLYGCRIVLFVHDEIIIECPEDRATTAGKELALIMILSMQKYTPDVRIQAEEAAMRRWYKDAETVRDAQGNLIPWEPEAKAA